jgi:hypothetical protein
VRPLEFAARDSGARTSLSAERRQARKSVGLEAALKMLDLALNMAPSLLNYPSAS